MHKPLKRNHLLLFTLITLLSTTIYVSFSETNSTPTLYIDPPFTTLDLGESFSVNVTIANVTDLGGWEFKLYYKNSILSILTASEGPFLKQGGSTSFFTVDFNNNYNTTHGRIWLTCVLLGGVPGVNGSGTLATINFQAIGGGNTTLHLTDTVLGDSQANPINHTTENGLVEVIPPVTITKVTPFATIAYQGIPFSINVTTLNEASDPATFNLTLYYNSTPIETKQITQPSGTNITTAFMWNTTALIRYKNYTINASTIHGTLTDGIVTLVYLGDVDADKDVDIYDVVKITTIYGSKLGDPEYDPESDIDCNTEIQIYDVVLCTSNYGYIE